MRCGLLIGLITFSLAGAEPTAGEVAATIIRDRAAALAASDDRLATTLRTLADGVASGRIALAEARDILAIQATLPPVSAGAPVSPSIPPPPAVPADQVLSVLDGAAASAPDVVQPAGDVLAIEPGADGNPALIAISIGALHGLREGQRLAISRDGATLVLARASQIRDDLTIALLIPGTWHGDDREIRIGDIATVVPSSE